MSWGQVVVLSVVQGLTEFLPVSSSGHLAIVSRIFFADDAGASFTAVTQLGTEAAVLVYFARDIVRILAAWFRGLRTAAHRTADYRLGWYVIIGTIPICVLGLFFKDEIRTGVRNLWVIATALVVFSAVIALAERVGRQSRDVEQLTWRDAVLVGFAQTLALVPDSKRNEASVLATKAALDLAEQAKSLGPLADLEQKVAANPLDHQARFDLALALNGKGKRLEALDHLISIVKRDRKWNDDGARKQLVQFFEAWGLMDPAAVAARRKLSALIF